MKKVINLFLVGVLIISMAVVSASAAPTPDVIERDISGFGDVFESASVASGSDPNVETEIDVGMGNSGIELRNSYIIVDDPVSAGGSEWTQPRGYCGYRVWVENTSNARMRVTVTSDGGTFVRYVDAHDSRTILVVNNAAEGRVHKINFMTSSGVGSGTVRVRVSDTAF